MSWEELLYLSDRHTTHAGVQDAGARAGTHLAGKGEPLLPVDTVGLHCLPGGARHKGHRTLRLGDDDNDGVVQKLRR